MRRSRSLSKSHVAALLAIAMLRGVRVEGGAAVCAAATVASRTTERLAAPTRVARLPGFTGPERGPGTGIRQWDFGPSARRRAATGILDGRSTGSQVGHG